MMKTINEKSTTTTTTTNQQFSPIQQDSTTSSPPPFQKTTTKIPESLLSTDKQQKLETTTKDEFKEEEELIDLITMEKTFKIKETVQWIQKHQFQIIGLQFPDSLLPISIKIFKLIQFQLLESSELSSESPSPTKKSKVELYVLADTSYGNCCVDVLAAQHVSAQAIIHYGRACMSPVTQLSVFYVLPRFKLEDSVMTSLVTELCDSFEKWRIDQVGSSKDVIPRVLLMYDLGYHWKADEIFKAIKKMKSDLEIELEVIKTEYVVGEEIEERSLGVPKGFLWKGGEKSVLEEQEDDKEKAKNSRSTSSSSSSEERRVLIGYIGGNSARLRHIGMTEMDKGLITIDPGRFPIKAESGEEARAKLMMKRYGVIQRARDADVYGLLIGRIGGGEVELNQDLELIKRTKELVEKRYSKKTYTISVGKIKKEKLGNFAEIECWIMFGCRENLLIEEGSKMLSDMVPVVTPWEAVIGLKSCFEGSDQVLWSGSCYEERRLIEMFKRWIEEEKEEEEEEDLPVFSLVTGQYKQRRRWKEKRDFDEDNDPTKDSSSSSCCLTNNFSKNPTSIDELIKVVGSAASEYNLVKRTFHGLVDFKANPNHSNHTINVPKNYQEPAAIVEKGRIGIPSSYLNEPFV